LQQTGRPITRARLARALAQAGATDAVYPVVDALDSPQEPLEVSTFGPQGTKARETTRIAYPVTDAATAFGERATQAIRKRPSTTPSGLFRIEAARALGKLGAQDAVPDLIAIATSDDRTPSERATAVAALTAIKSPQGRDAFAKALVSEDAV